MRSSAPNANRHRASVKYEQVFSLTSSEDRKSCRSCKSPLIWPKECPRQLNSVWPHVKVARTGLSLNWQVFAAQMLSLKFNTSPRARGLFRLKSVTICISRCLHLALNSNLVMDSGRNQGIQDDSTCWS